MKNTYKVVLTVSDRTVLADIIDAVENKADSIDISTVGAPAPAAKLNPVSSLRQPRIRKANRNKRVSKVNTAILEAVGAQPASISALKDALEKAGMSASSLSTGIAHLTKSGQIERVGEGVYGLKMPKAAE